MAVTLTGPSRPVAVLDACVLIPPGLRDMLLSCADQGAFRPVWQARILEEMMRNGVRLLVEKKGLNPQDAEAALEHTAAQMRRAFPDAELDASLWEALESKMTCDGKDRHVMAAGVASAATHLVTANLSDFPEDSWGPGLVVVSPDEFLSALLETRPDGVVAAVNAMSKRQRKPLQTPQEIAAHFAAGPTAPEFGKALVGALT